MSFSYCLTSRYSYVHVLHYSLNPYSWNKIANLVFIEQPCGVGFSYSDDPEGTGDYKTDDAQAAKDNYALIAAFFVKFPEYTKNKLYIASESYGGHYMPQLSKEIVDRNTAGLDPVMNFKGMMVGNPGTTFYSIMPAGLDTYWGHQLISKPLYDGFVNDCRNAPHFNVSSSCCSLLLPPSEFSFTTVDRLRGVLRENVS